MPPDQRKRYDPANQIKWGWNAISASVKNYSTVNQQQLYAAAQSGAHWLDKRVREAASATERDQCIFAGLDRCYLKLKKRGAEFPQINFSSTSPSIDIQRCSSSDDGAQLKNQPQQEKQKQQGSPSSVVQKITEDGCGYDDGGEF